MPRPTASTRRLLRPPCAPAPAEEWTVATRSRSAAVERITRRVVVELQWCALPFAMFTCIVTRQRATE